MFEQHFTMLEKNRCIFEQYKNLDKIGLKIVNNKQYCSFGKDLLTSDTSNKFLQVRSIHYYNVVTKKLKDFSLPEWLVCLNEEILLEFAVPIFSRVLEKYPMLCGMNREWQVLYSITKIENKFWLSHKSWKKYFDEFIDKILLEHTKGNLCIPSDYLEEFSKFKMITL